MRKKTVSPEGIAQRMIIYKTTEEHHWSIINILLIYEKLFKDTNKYNFYSQGKYVSHVQLYFITKAVFIQKHICNGYLITPLIIWK